MMKRIINRLWFIFKVLTIISAFSDQECCNETLIQNKTVCCMTCPADYYNPYDMPICKGDNVDYLSEEACEEASEICQRCTVCDDGVNQIEDTPCKPTQDRRCRCKDGHYNNKAVPGRLICQSCKDCNDSKCPECPETPKCKNGTYMDQTGNCIFCQEQNCDKPHCKDSDICASRSSILVIVIVLILLLLVGLLLISIRCLAHCERKHCWTSKEKNNNLPDQCHEDTNKITQMSKQGDQDQITIAIPQGFPNLLKEVKIAAPSAPEFEPPVQPSEESQMGPCTQSLIKNEYRGHYSSPMLLSSQHAFSKYEAQVLYIIIREVPVRRWKEFLRLLSVPDEEIERVEMETGTSYLERQYQMLRLWSQGSNSNLESLYSTLHSMDLSGCAEKLRDKLQTILHTTSQPS